MADTEIRAGDTVRLKSGGPLMTVTQTSNQNGALQAWVSWFDSNQEAKNGHYPVAALEKDAGDPVIL